MNYTILKAAIFSELLKKMYLGMLFTFVIFLSTSCKKENVTSTEQDAEKEHVIDDRKTRQTESQPKNDDELFLDFIEHFSKDSVFQMSRVNFPLKVQHLDDDFALVELVLEKQDYVALNFIYPKDHIEFAKKITSNKNKATIEVRGTENGIMIDFFFQKINGQWELKTWIDRST